MKKCYLRIVAAAMACMILLAGCGEKDEKKTDREKQHEETVTVECLVSLTQDYGDGAAVRAVRYEEQGVCLSATELVDAYVDLYTPDGRQLQSVYYNEEGVKRYCIDYTYNEKGLKIGSLQTNTIENEVANRGEFTYDDAGNLLRISDYAGGKVSAGYAEFAYDDQGFPVSYDYVDHEGTNLWHYNYTCDDNGRIVTGTVEYILTDNQLTQLGYYTCTYDEAGRLTSQCWTTTQRSYFVFSDYFYTYDEEGRLIRAQVVDDDGEIDSDTVYTYDDQGRLLSIADEADNVSMVFNYATVELPEKLAEDARIWSTQGVIQVMAPMPEYER